MDFERKQRKDFGQVSVKCGKHSRKYYGMMDKVLGGTMGVLKHDVTMVTDMIDKYKGRTLPESNLPRNISSDGNVKNESYGCRHCQEKFSTLLGLQQHIVCDHTEELRTELNQYTQKKSIRPKQDSGAIHPKKRKILEAVQASQKDHSSKGRESWEENSRNGFQGNIGDKVKDLSCDDDEDDDDDDDDDEDRLVISTSPAPLDTASKSPAPEDEFMSYTHKKLKRKNYLETKGELKQEDDIEKEYEKIIDKAKREIDQENNEIREKLKQTELLYTASKFQAQVPPETAKPKEFANAQSSPLYNEAPPSMPQQENGLPYPPMPMNPGTQRPMYPAINMNMYGNFAMPMNFPTHPMMFMNSGMFMPPMTSSQQNGSFIPQVNPMPSSPLPSRVAEISSPKMSPQRQASPQAEKTKKTRTQNANRRNRNVERKGSLSDEKTHSDEKSEVVEIYECKVCSRKFSQVGNFHNHMKLHNEKSCSCGICKVEFSDSYELQRHMRTTHTGSMPYKCNECDREFSQYNNLRRHLRVHSGKSYKCHICGRSFNEVFYLEMHIGSHTGERTYKCGVCNLTFRDNAELQRHVKTHSADELHTCEVCGKSFSKACVLRQHKKMHLGVRPYKCNICEKAFIHRHHLTIHMRMHNTSKPYTCKFCHREFTQTSHLYKHIEKQHEEEIGKAVDLNAKNGKKGIPSAAEIEELFCKIQSPSNSSSASIDSGNVDNLVRPRSDSNVSQADSAISLPRSNVSQISVDTPPPVEYSSTPQYSPISSASSQCDNEVRSITPTIEVLTKSSSQSVPSSEASSTMDSMSHPVTQENPTRNPIHNEKKVTSPGDKIITHFNPAQIQDTCIKTENYSMSPDVGRITDTDLSSQDSRPGGKDPSLVSASSPCSSLSSDSAVGISDIASPPENILSPEAIKKEKLDVGEEKPKKRRRRRKKAEMDSQSISNPEAVHSSSPNTQVPNPQMMMPSITSDVQQMYLMQMQQLQGLHMAMFANAMAGQTYPNAQGTKVNIPVTTMSGTPPPPYGFGNPMNMFMKTSQSQAFSPLVPQARFQTPSSETPAPIDLSVDK